MTLEQLNLSSPQEAEQQFLTCCGSSRWAQEMTVRRPFHHLEDLFRTISDVWTTLAPEDWREAFQAHPRIGEQISDVAGGSAQARAWASQEQSGITGAAAEEIDQLESLNREYEARFGHTFIICATGKRADEMLIALRSRLHNLPDVELKIAADQEQRITHIRLQKLLTGGAADGVD